MQDIKLLYRRRRNKNILVMRNGKEGVIDALFGRFSYLNNNAKRIIKAVRSAIKDSNAVLCGELLKELGKVDDRLLEFGKQILPYIQPRLQALEINKKVTKRYVVRVPTVIQNTDQWLQKVKQEQALIPKFDVNKAMQVEEVEEIEEDDYDESVPQNLMN